MAKVSLSSLPRHLREKLQAVEVVPVVGPTLSPFPAPLDLVRLGIERLRAQRFKAEEQANRAETLLGLGPDYYAEVARLIRSGLQSLNLWNAFVLDQLDSEAAGSAVQGLVWRLGSEIVVTTNHDPSLADSAPGRCEQWSTRPDMPPLDARRAVVWHLNGRSRKPGDVVFAPEWTDSCLDKLEVGDAYYDALRELHQLMLHRTLLFVGYDDANPPPLAQLRWMERHQGSFGLHYLLVDTDTPWRHGHRSEDLSEAERLGLQALEARELGGVSGALGLLAAAATRAEVAQEQSPEPAVELAWMNEKDHLLIVYKGADGVRSDHEVERIEQIFEHEDDVSVDAPRVITPEKVVRMITADDPTILHFSSHGKMTAAGAAIELSADDGGDSWLFLEGLADHLSKRWASESKRFKLVFLNTCFVGDFAEQMLDFTDVVIGTTHEIQDSTARYLAEQFYLSASKSGVSLRQAYDTACGAAAASGKHPADALQLVDRLGVAERVFLGA